MNISKLFVAALLTTAAGATEIKKVSYAPVTDSTVKIENSPTNVLEGKGETQESNVAGSRGIRLSGVTGEVQIVTPGGTMTVKKGEPVPAIPSGSTIKVISGDVAVQAGGVTVKAGAGDSFTINTNGAAVSIAVTGGLVSVVGADGVSKDVAKGEGVTVASGAAPAIPAVVAAPKAEEPAAPESIPADTETDTTVTTPPATSPVQESATTTSSCVPSTVSGSTPCP